MGGVRQCFKEISFINALALELYFNTNYIYFNVSPHTLAGMHLQNNK